MQKQQTIFLPDILVILLLPSSVTERDREQRVLKKTKLGKRSSPGERTKEKTMRRDYSQRDPVKGGPPTNFTASHCPFDGIQGSTV